MGTTETDRLVMGAKLKEYAPFALVILITAAIIAYLVMAPKAHAETTKAEAVDNVDIEQSLSYIDDSAELFPAVYGSEAQMTAPFEGIDGVRTWAPDKVNNAVGYQVSVSNKGTLPAYIRTVIALEEPSGRSNALTYLNASTTDFTWSKVPGSVQIDGASFAIYVAVYSKSLDVNQTVDVVSQIAMDADAVNSDLAPLGEKYNIKVASQAAQYDPNQTASALLDSRFGAITADKHPWSSSSESAGSSTTDATGEASN